MARAISCVLASVFLSACGTADVTQALHETLAQERVAHLETDAGLLASLIDDSLVTVQSGQVGVQPRSDVFASFEAYFEGASYERWDDLEPPRITIAPDGSTAWVARRVEVRRSAERFGVPQIEDFVSSWVATYRWNGGRWLMTANSSGTGDPADRIVAAGIRAVGAPAAVNQVQQVNFKARVTGPGASFEVDVRSSRDGRARLAFRTGATLGIEADRGWQTSDGTLSEITPAEHEFVRGHELLIRVVAPYTRFPALGHAGHTVVDQQAAIRLSGVDNLGGAVDAFYSVSDTTFLGFRVEDHLGGRGTVSVALSDWRPVEELELPHRAVFTQGPETFVYDLFDVATSRTLPS